MFNSDFHPFEFDRISTTNFVVKSKLSLSADFTTLDQTKKSFIEIIFLVVTRQKTSLPHHVP